MSSDEVMIIADEEDLEMEECPLCHSELIPGEGYLGFFGNRTHYRCPYCGGQWSEASDFDGGHL